MAVPRLTDDLDFIQKLSDNPNDTDGLSAAELKARFDAAVNVIKLFLNGSLAAALDAIQENANKLDGKTVSNVLGVDNSTIPTSAAVRASMSSAGMGDMAAATYDTQNKRQDIFQYADSAVGGHSTDPEAHNDIRTALQEAVNRINAVLDSDDETLDELSEIVAYIKSNSDLLEAVTLAKVSVADIVNDLATNVSTKPLSAAQGVVIRALLDNVAYIGEEDPEVSVVPLNADTLQGYSAGYFTEQIEAGRCFANLVLNEDQTVAAATTWQDLPWTIGESYGDFFALSGDGKTITFNRKAVVTLCSAVYVYSGWTSSEEAYLDIRSGSDPLVRANYRIPAAAPYESVGTTPVTTIVQSGQTIHAQVYSGAAGGLIKSYPYSSFLNIDVKGFLD